MDFINREKEFAELNHMAAQPGAQFVMVYGRRRVGKTTLLTTWAARSGLPTFYWVAKRETRPTLMANLAQQIWAWEHNLDRANVDIRPTDWDAPLKLLAQAHAQQKRIIILDELPYLMESDPAFASYLQAAWDHQFKQMPVCLLVSGSHMGMMTRLVEYQAPLYGRFTVQLPLGPLAFPDIAAFLPSYDVHKRLAVYAILGGIPAYLEHLRSSEPLAANLERLFLDRSAWLRNEPIVLISDLTPRESNCYESILRPIASGYPTRVRTPSVPAIPPTSLATTCRACWTCNWSSVVCRPPCLCPSVRSARRAATSCAIPSCASTIALSIPTWISSSRG